MNGLSLFHFKNEKDSPCLFFIAQIYVFFFFFWGNAQIYVELYKQLQKDMFAFMGLMSA